MAENENGQSAEPEVQEAQEGGTSPAGEDLEGIKSNRDAILKEKKALQRKLDALVKEQETIKTKELEEKEKWRELYEKGKTELETWKNKHKESERKRKLETICLEKGYNPKYSSLLEGVEYDEDGNVTNADTIFAQMKESDPNLFTDATGQPIKVDSKKPNLTGTTNQAPVSRAEYNEMMQKISVGKLTADDFNSLMVRIEKYGVAE